MAECTDRYHRTSTDCIRIFYNRTLRSTEDGSYPKENECYDQEKPYDLGNGFSHIAVGVEDIEAERERHISLGYEVTPMKGLSDGAATYYFVTDPDGYKVEVIKL